MKLSAREAPGVFRSPDPRRPGILIYGADPMRIATRRQEMSRALVGPEGEAEMRLTRLHGPDLRKDPAALIDAVKAQGFFPGARAVVVEDAADTLTQALSAALEDWREGDAVLVVTAGQLTARSSLRKLFEAHPAAYATGIYDDPPSRDEVARMIADAALGALDRDAEEALSALARDLPPGDFRQTLEKLALYTHGGAGPVSAEDVAQCAPLAPDADLDDLLAVIGAGQAGQVPSVLRRLAAQGVLPVTVCIGVLRYFRQLHQAATDPGGPGSGIARVKPPVFGPRRDRMVRAAQAFGLRRIETGLTILLDTDLQLRSTTDVPPGAMLERALIRLTMLGASSR